MCGCFFRTGMFLCQLILVKSRSLHWRRSWNFANRWIYVGSSSKLEGWTGGPSPLTPTCTPNLHNELMICAKIIRASTSGSGFKKNEASKKKGGFKKTHLFWSFPLFFKLFVFSKPVIRAFFHHPNPGPLFVALFLTPCPACLLFLIIASISI